MLHLSGSEFTDLFHTCQRSAFHLETHDTYGVPNESEPFRKFLAGEEDDYRWLSDWLTIVRDATSRGVQFTRARVVTETHADYKRWGLVVARENIAAGEDIRYLPRHRIDPGDLTADDYWLFDEETVAFTLFTPNGAAAGAAATRDRTIVDRCRRVRDDVWQLAVPRADYVRVHVGR
jgi:hypothetical protein